MKKIIAIAAGLLILTLTACSSHTDALLKPAPLVKFSPSLKVKRAWSHRIGQGTSSLYLHLLPAVVGDTLFVPAYDGHMAAYNKITGRQRWKKFYPGHLISGVAADNGLLFVTTDDGHLMAIQQQNGQVAWETNTGDQVIARPQAADGKVFIHATNGSLTAYNEKNGQQLWQFKQQTPNLLLYLSSQPQVSGKTVVCGFANGKLVALDADSGAVIWIQQIAQPMGQTDIQRMVDISSTPLIIGNTIYVATYQGSVMAVNLKNGHTLWQHKLSVYNNIASDGKNLYVSDADSNIWAFDLKTGTVIWRDEKLARRDITGIAIMKKDHALIVGDYKSYVHFLSLKDGHILARQHVDFTSILTTPVVSGDMVGVYGISGRFAAYRVNV